MHQATTISVVVITEHRKSFFLIHPNEVLCFASVLSTEMEEGWIVGNIRQGNRHSSFLFFFFFIKHTKKNEDDKRESEILINNSGIRAINRQYWIFRTLEGWSQLRWRRTGS